MGVGSALDGLDRYAATVDKHPVLTVTSCVASGKAENASRDVVQGFKLVGSEG